MRDDDDFKVIRIQDYGVIRVPILPSSASFKPDKEVINTLPLGFFSIN